VTQSTAPFAQFYNNARDFGSFALVSVEFEGFRLRQLMCYRKLSRIPITLRTGIRSREAVIRPPPASAGKTYPLPFVSQANEQQISPIKTNAGAARGQ
jgi:hypothetical protein